MNRTLVCTCEDVTLGDVESAIASGQRDIESLKRYTGLGTGMCQGKLCLSTAAGCLARAGGKGDPPVQPFTVRPPLIPTELRLLASWPLDSTHVGGSGPSGDLPTASLASERPPLPERRAIVIVGGGIMGLALAYALGERGVRDVIVLEQSYLCAGASGRNGGGVRMQWGTPSLVELARRSIDLMKSFSRQLGIHIWLRQGGYLFLARSRKVAERLERSTLLQQSLGLRTELLSPGGARDLVPGLTAKDIALAAFHAEDGVIFPWPFLWGYAQGFAKHGIAVETFTKVLGFDISGGQIRSVQTDRGRIACDTVVLAAGAWSPEIAKLAGIELPNVARRHEILSAEPLKPFMEPLISVLDTGLYISQSMRGELVGGMGEAAEPEGLRMDSSFRFLARFSQGLLEQLPSLGQVKVLRQWAGCYDVTPDNNPILGRTPGLENLLQMSGFVGHGFMMAPAVAERMASWIATGGSDDLFTRYNLDRFAAGGVQAEEMIIG